MNKLNFKLKLNKIYERNFKTRKKIWEIKKILNEVEKEHNENYESIEYLLDILIKDMKNKIPENYEVNGTLPTWNKVETKGGQMSEQSTIHIVLRKDKQYGRTLYYTTKKEDVWLPLIHNQQSLTQHNIDYLKMTGRFSFELMREEI